MKQEYEKIVRSVCMLDDWRRSSYADKRGAIGVGIVLAYMNGVRANPEDLARHLDISRGEVEVPFRRLLVNGIFSQRYDIREDSVLTGKSEGSPNSGWQRQQDFTRSAWCVLAGIASGLCGLRESNYRPPEEQPRTRK